MFSWISFHKTCIYYINKCRHVSFSITDVSKDEVSQDVPRRKIFGALFARRRSAVVAEMGCSSERYSRASWTLILQLKPQPVSSEVSEDMEYHERDFESIQPARKISADNRKVLKSRVFDQSSGSHPDSVQVTLPPPCSPATPRQPAITPPPCSPATPRRPTIPPWTLCSPLSPRVPAARRRVDTTEPLPRQGRGRPKKPVSNIWRNPCQKGERTTKEINVLYALYYELNKY